MEKKLVWLFIVVVVLAAAGCTSGGGDMTGGDQLDVAVFGAPEEAIAWYVEGVANTDTDQILQACAVDEISQNFKLVEDTERVSAFMPSVAYGPSDYPFYVETNRAEASGLLAADMVRASYGADEAWPCSPGKYQLDGSCCGR